MPVILVNKLGRHIGISTATGDFYDLSPKIYVLLKKWNRRIALSVNALSGQQAAELAKTLNIPHGIAKFFPYPDKKISSPADENPPACLTDLTLNLTSDCNLRCIYCWNDHGKYSNTRFSKIKKGRKRVEGPANTRMDAETALRAVDTLVKLRGREKSLVVDFYGGEPLLNLETLMATVDYCRENQAKWKVEFHFLLATNGTLLTPALAKRLLDKGVQVAVSIDGPKAVHDRNRPFTGRRGSFDTIVSNLKSMPKPVMRRLVGRTTVTPFFPDMVKLYGNLRGLGFERIEIFESEDACH